MGQQHPDSELLQEPGHAFHVTGRQAGPIPLGRHRGTALGLPCSTPRQGSSDVRPPQAFIAYVAVALCSAGVYSEQVTIGRA